MAPVRSPDRAGAARRPAGFEGLSPRATAAPEAERREIPRGDLVVELLHAGPPSAKRAER
jgi:hypothetical protein